MWTIDKSWTLFLDRDGVINVERPNDYVLHWDQFIFYEGAIKAIQLFTEKFGRIVVATNQKCIGRGLISHEGLATIHQNMKQQIIAASGKIDEIYYCPEMSDTHFDRKPNPGMAYQAKFQFPEIDFGKSIMVGNNLSDMQFAKAVGIKTVFLTTTKALPHPASSLIDLHFESLAAFAHQLS
jgi:histidinol-phosphate phosphatase family protein